MGLARIPVKLPVGGINNSVSPAELEADETYAMRNFTNRRVNAVGPDILSVRNTMARTSTTGGASVGAQSIDNLVEFPDGVFVASVDGDIYKITNLATGAASRLFDGTVGTVWSFAVIRNSLGVMTLWAMNGTDAPQKWDGAAASTSAWANSPPNGTCICAWKGRVIVTGASASIVRVYFSDVGNPESPAASYGNNTIDIRTNVEAPADEENSGLLPVGENLLLFKKGSVHVIYDAVAFSNRQVGPRGIADFRSADEYGGVGYFLSGVHQSTMSIWSTDGTELVQETPQFNSVDFSDTLCIDRDAQKLYTILDQSSVNNEWIEVDLTQRNSRKARPVFIHKLGAGATALEHCFWTPGSGLVLTENGKYWIEQNDFSAADDTGGAAVAYFTLRPISAQAREPVERIRRVIVGYLAGLNGGLGSAGTVYVESRTDSLLLQSEADDTSSYSYSKELTKYTEDPGVPAGRYFEETVRPESRGRYHQIMIVAEAGEYFGVSGIEVHYRGGKEKK